MSDFDNSVESEYPIGKYKSGEYKLCYVCNNKFRVGDIYINSSIAIKNRKIFKDQLTKEFGKDVAEYRIHRMGKVKSVIIHSLCQPESNQIKNLIYSPSYSCIL
tara:strand:- start:117 stop:428 length:312 start_codon:yes stop_codon:yes gene_type:complete